MTAHYSVARLAPMSFHAVVTQPTVSALANKGARSRLVARRREDMIIFIGSVLFVE